MSTTQVEAYERVVLEGVMPYSDRATKAVWFAERFADALTGSVLDVGCDDAKLRHLVAEPARYVGVDLTDAADVRIDLDTAPLPFEPGSFDTVVCLDVLEHLERIHGVFDALCTVTSRSLLVSLPNPARTFIDEVITGREGRLKHYGLPLEPRKDRHRWFFGADEAEAFVVHRAMVNGMRVRRIEFEPLTPVQWEDGNGRDVLESERLRLGSMWAWLTKGGAGGGDHE